MKLAEILRTLADTIDHYSQDEEQAEPTQVAVVEPESDGEVVDQSGEAEQPAGVFIPPLQLKIELLKKAVNVDNVYDHAADMDAETHSQEIPVKEDEIATLRRSAGINPAVIQEFANEEPLDD
jgi:hypothetical protein